MELRSLSVLLICAMAVMVAGCTTGTSPDAPATISPDTPSITAPTPMNAMGCTVYADCVPASCCHPTSCINRVAAPPCVGIACTMSCEGPLDCGAGSCGCVQGRCSVVAVQQNMIVVTSPIQIEAYPARYSPIMSSTPGVGLVVNAPGIDRAATDFVWTASLGRFLTWNPPDYIMNEKGSTLTNHGEKVYWSFTDKPASTESPVIITMTARETATKKEIGRSTLTLDWDGDYAVMVRETT